MTDTVVPPTQTEAERTGVPDDGRYPFSIPFGWFQIAWLDELEPGAVLPKYYFDRHLVVWRGDDGEVHVQDAFCPHLGAHLGHGGVVENNELRCPFHGWRFDGEGHNSCIPYSDRTNAKAKVRTYPSLVLDDYFVMVWYHPHEVDPLWQVELPPEALSEGYTDWVSIHKEMAAGMQDLAENSVDGPHFRYVHNTDVVPEIEEYDTTGFVAKTRSIQKFPTPRGIVDGRIDVDNYGPGFSRTRFQGIIDTVLIGAAIPVTQDRCEVRFSFKTAKLDDELMTSGVSQAFINEVSQQFEDDRPIWENKAMVARPALADTDPPFLQFRKWYTQFYADGVRTDKVWWTPPAPEEGQPVYIPPVAETAGRKYRQSE